MLDGCCGGRQMRQVAARAWPPCLICITRCAGLSEAVAPIGSTGALIEIAIAFADMPDFSIARRSAELQLHPATTAASWSDHPCCRTCGALRERRLGDSDENEFLILPGDVGLFCQAMQAGAGDTAGEMAPV